MAIDKKTVDAFEKEYKDGLFGKLYKARDGQIKVIAIIKNRAKDLGQSETNIPITSILVNNKIVELLHIFEKAGISMFSSIEEQYDMVTSSFIGDAIILDLLDKLGQSTKKMQEYCNKMGEICNARNEKMQVFQNMGTIRRLFEILKSIFSSGQLLDLSLTDEEQNMLDNSMKEYCDLSDEIFKYNLEDNIVPALVKHIAGPEEIQDLSSLHRFNPELVPGLLEEYIVPDFEKLGLEYLVPKLQDSLIQEYKQDLPQDYSIKKEDMDLYVPNFSNKKEGLTNGDTSAEDMEKKDESLIK